MSEQDAERHSHDPRQWFNRQDEVSTPGGAGSSASTPLHPSSFFRKLRGRLRSSSESSASVSDSGILEDDRDVMGTQDVSVWPRQRSSSSLPRQAGTASLLPAELLIHVSPPWRSLLFLTTQIMRYLPANGDLLSAMQVSRSWCLAGYPLLWQKPALNNIEAFASFVRVLASPKTLLPYTDIIKRLSIAGFAREVHDDLFRPIALCKRLERLTLSGAVLLTPRALNSVFRHLKELIAIDVSGVTDVDDEVTQGIAANCPKTQGLNLTDCKLLTDEGVLAIAGSMKNLRRVRKSLLSALTSQIKLSGCQRLTDRSIVALVRACPLLLELDLAGVPQLSNDSTIAMFFNTQYLRELRMNDNKVINDLAIPDLEKIPELSEQALLHRLGAYPWYLQAGVATPKAMSSTATNLPDVDPVLLRPVTLHFEQLRQVDFTSCTLLRDQAIESLVSNASKLRSITLAKCVNLTDASVDSITRLGKHLHYLHLGHVSL